MANNVETLENAKLEVRGGKLFIEVDLDMTLRPSASGKTLLIASGQGAVPGSNAKISISVYRKP